MVCHRKACFYEAQVSGRKLPEHSREPVRWAQEGSGTSCFLFPVWRMAPWSWGLYTVGQSHVLRLHSWTFIACCLLIILFTSNKMFQKPVWEGFGPWATTHHDPLSCVQWLPHQAQEEQEEEKQQKQHSQSQGSCITQGGVLTKRMKGWEWQRQRHYITLAHGHQRALLVRGWLACPAARGKMVPYVAVAFVAKLR